MVPSPRCDAKILGLLIFWFIFLSVDHVGNKFPLFYQFKNNVAVKFIKLNVKISLSPILSEHLSVLFILSYQKEGKLCAIISLNKDHSTASTLPVRVHFERILTLRAVR